MNGMETYLAGSPLVAVGAAFASGILTGLSPCVYSMIPIVTGYVGGRAVKERALCEHCGPVTNIEAVVQAPEREGERDIFCFRSDTLRGWLQSIPCSA